jgi:hypothetical protein
VNVSYEIKRRALGKWQTDYIFWTAGSKGSEPAENFEWCPTDIGVKRGGTAPSWAKVIQEMAVNDGSLTLDLKGSSIGLSYRDSGGLNSVLCEVILAKIKY